MKSHLLFAHKHLKESALFWNQLLLSNKTKIELISGNISVEKVHFIYSLKYRLNI